MIFASRVRPFDDLPSSRRIGDKQEVQVATKQKSEDSKTMRDPKTSKEEKSAAAKDLAKGSHKSTKK